MKKLNPGPTISVLANVGVLIGILLLVYELNQNRVVAEAQTRAAISQSIIDLTVMINQTEMGMAIAEKRLNGEALTPREQIWQRGTSRAQFRHWENVYFQYNIGLFSDQELETYRTFWRTVTRCRPWQGEFWSDTRMQFNPMFREEMDLIFREAAEC